jgi:hypothetical protein
MKQSVWAVLVFLLVPVVAAAQSLTLTPPAGFTGGADVSALLKVADAIASGTMPASQAGVPSYELRVYAASADVTTATPVQKTKAPDTLAQCGVQPGVDAKTLNDAKAVEFHQDVTDPASPLCRIDFASFFGGLPVGQAFTFTIVHVDGAGNPDSAVSAPSDPLARLRGSGGKAPHRPWWRAVIDFLLFKWL